ncbi:MAG: hypothetical protein EBX37_08975, partial [Alphaproteobacteria bacterium]|nr:hypothetical protein [Alphaproteobacteria bacterium]
PAMVIIKIHLVVILVLLKSLLDREAMLHPVDMFVSWQALAISVVVTPTYQPEQVLPAPAAMSILQPAARVTACRSTAM